jgi:hypothetical protein
MTNCTIFLRDLRALRGEKVLSETSEFGVENNVNFLCSIPIKVWYRVYRAALRRLFFEILQRGKVENGKQKAESRKLTSSALAKASVVPEAAADKTEAHKEVAKQR